jgi:hypothetical protein
MGFAMMRLSAAVVTMGGLGLVGLGAACGPAGGGGAGGATEPPPATSSSGTTNPGGGCAAPGEVCSESMPCCMSGQNSEVGPLGATCVSNDNSCHANCTTGSDCTSGCCTTLVGQNFGVCADPSYCCVDPGGSCTENGQCCQTGSNVGAYGATCVSNDDTCHAKCHSGGDCASGCCLALTGESYGACAAASYCP